jgi:hypothetical protein
MLPTTWRDVLSERCSDNGSASAAARINARRLELEAEQKRLIITFTKGYLSESDLDIQVEHIRKELGMLSAPLMQGAYDNTDAVITAGETLSDMASFWMEALPEERRDIVWALLTPNGLVYDLERAAIVGLTPRDDMLPALALGLESRWEQRAGGLWLCAEHLPPKRKRQDPHAPLPMQYKLDFLERGQAREMARSGMTMRQIAEHFGVSRMAIWRSLNAEEEAIDG